MKHLLALDPHNAEVGGWNAIIETPQGSRNKFAFDPERGIFQLKRVLPLGMVFPYDFGFLPSTLAEDGDPLDVLVLMDTPTFPGCVVAVRLVGVIEGEQTEEGETNRNDRLIAVAGVSHNHRCIRALDQLSDNVLTEIEHFFVSYHELQGRKFKPLGRHGPGKALELVEEGMRCFRKGKAEGNGKKNGRSRKKHAKS